MTKLVTLFLIGIVILAMFGKLRAPWISRNSPRRCKSCGSFLIGSGPCHCKTKRS